MPISAARNKIFQKPLFPWVWIACVAAIILSFPFVIQREGMLGLYAVVGGVVALALVSAHPLVTFCLYFSALFFSDTRIPGIPVSVNQVLGLLFLGAGGLYALRGRGVFPRSSVLPLLLAVSAYFAVNAGLGQDPERGIMHMRYVAIYLVVTLTLVTSLNSERAVLALAWVIVGTTTIAALHGLFQAFEKNVLQAFAGHWDNRVRIQGTAKNAIVYGWNMVYAFPFAFFLYSEMRTLLPRMLALGMGALCLFAALFTFNRQTFIYMALVLGAAIFLYTYRNRRVLLFASGVGGVLAALTVLPMMVRRLMTFGNLTRDWSFLERRDSYLVGMQMYSENPIFGVGLGSFPSMYKEYIPENYPTFFVQYWGGEQLKFPDLGYLQLLAEGGLVGLGLVLILFAAFLWKAWQYRKLAVQAGDSFVQNLASTAIVLVGFVLITTAIQDTFLYPRVWLVFSLVLLLNPSALPLRVAAREPVATS